MRARQSSVLLWAGVVSCMATATVPRPLDSDGDGIADERDLCPEARENVNGIDDWDGCPEPENRADGDGDGVLDVADRCPEEPEEKDGFEDDDGCPDPDNDHDRILDPNDKCPNEPERYNNVDDDDGCPDVDMIKIR
jgi:hypothetical protein